MAGIPLLSGFNITSDSPADTRLVLTKAEMKAMKDTSMPQTYFCTDSESGDIYVYNKTNEVDETTGKFRKFESGAANAVTTDTEQTITGTKHFTSIRGNSNGTDNEDLTINAYGEEGCGITLNGRGGSVKIGGQDIVFNSAFRPTWDGKSVATEDELIKTVDGNSPDSNGNVTSAFGNLTNDLNTENTTDTWVPVLANGKVQHRVISTDLATNDNITKNFPKAYDFGAISLAQLKTYTNTYPPFIGSSNVSDGPGGNTWYNVQWIPHRNGSGSGDNSNYGNLIMYPMTTASSTFYRYEKINNTWYGPYSYQAMQISVNTSNNTATITY